MCKQSFLAVFPVGVAPDIEQRPRSAASEQTIPAIRLSQRFSHEESFCALCQFLSPTINQRTDRYGGSLENRSRIIVDIIEGIRERCSPGFLLGVRLSPERFDLKL